MQAIPSALNVIHCLFPFHHSLLFPMKSYTSFRVQLKCHHLHVVHLKICPNPFPCRYGSLSFAVSSFCVLCSISIILQPSDYNRSSFISGPISFYMLLFPQCIWFPVDFFFFFLDVLVTQSCLTFFSTVDCSPTGSSVHEIHQVKNTGAISFSRGSSPPRDRTWVACIAGRFFTIWATRQVPLFGYKNLK